MPSIFPQIPLSVANGGTGTSTAQTQNRVILAGASGVFSSSASLTFDGSSLAVGGSAEFSGNVGIFTTPSARLHVLGPANAPGFLITNGNGPVWSRIYAENLFCGLEFGISGGADQFVTGSVTGDAMFKGYGFVPSVIFGIEGLEILTLKAAGHVLSRFPTSAPDDSKLHNSMGCLWWDEGAGAVKFKGRDSGGTIKTATVCSPA